MTDTMKPEDEATLADFLTPAKRRLVYAWLRLANTVWLPLAPILLVSTDSKWAVGAPSIVLALANGAGFTISKLNTPQEG